MCVCHALLYFFRPPASFSPAPSFFTHAFSADAPWLRTLPYPRFRSLTFFLSSRLPHSLPRRRHRPVRPMPAQDFCTALHSAEKNGHLDVARLLEDRGADMLRWRQVCRTLRVYLPSAMPAGQGISMLQKHRSQDRHAHTQALAHCRGLSCRRRVKASPWYPHPARAPPLLPARGCAPATGPPAPPTPRRHHHLPRMHALGAVRGAHPRVAARRRGGRTASAQLAHQPSRGEAGLPAARAPACESTQTVTDAGPSESPGGHTQARAPVPPVNL